MAAAIIVAAGKGIRMRGPVRKQYLPLAGLPVLSRTLTVFDACDRIDCIYLVVPEEDFDFCREKILGPLKVTTEIRLVCGGARRQDSVYEGLQAADRGYDIVVIHDGVRPFVKVAQLMDCIDGAMEFGACILGVQACDTLKQVDASGKIVQTVARENIWMAQTPQAFRYDLIKKAHASARLAGVAATDDASLVERLGHAVKMISGSRSNIKITSIEDLELAQSLIDGLS